MKRKDFYAEYYRITNRPFSDKILWNQEDHKKAWRKGQLFSSKTGRIIHIIFQYLVLLLCWIPMYFDRDKWVIITIALIIFLSQSYITNFSIIKIELLYYIYRKNNVYCSMLHDIFIGEYTDFFDKLKRLTKKQVIGYFLKSGGTLYGKFNAVCRNKSNKIILIFRFNKVVVSVNEAKIEIKNKSFTEEELLTEISSAIQKHL